MSEKILIIIPTYNEILNIKELIPDILNEYRNASILIVDDNSPDGTGEYVYGLTKKSERINLINRPKKMGLGTAYIEGFRFALEKDYEFIFEMDADYSHSPAEIKNFLAVADKYDLIIGSRYVKGGRIKNWSKKRLILSRLANFYTKIITGLSIHDATGGFKCFRRKVLKSLNLANIKSNGYAFQIETNFKVWKKGFKIHEIPITFSERKIGSSKLSKKIIMEAILVTLKLKLEDMFSFIFKKRKIWMWALLALGFIFRLFYIFIFTNPENYLWSDPGGYDDRALQMANNQHIMFSTYWPPFFHIIWSLVYRPLLWLGLESWRIKIDVIIFALLYILGFWCIYHITKKLFTEKIALILLTALILWYPFIFFNYLVMSENLFFPLIFLGLYFLIVKPLKLSSGFWIGLFWGAAFLSRPIFVLVLPFFVIWGFRNKINWKILTIFTSTILMIIASMMLFNFYYTKGAEKSFSSNGGVGFAALWCDAKSIGFYKNGYSFGFGWPGNIDYPDSRRIHTSIPFENQKYYYKMGLSCLKQHPERLISNISSVAKLFHSHLFPAIGDVAYWGTFRLIFKIIAGLLSILALSTIIGLATDWMEIKESDKKYFYLFGLIILSLIITIYLLNPGEERYIIPYTPLLMMLSVPSFLALSKLVDKNRL